MRYEGGQYFVKSEAEMASLFPYVPQAIENTQKIADRCNVEIEFGVTKLPRFDVPEGYDSWGYLNHLCDEGFAMRYPNDDGTLRARLDYELGTIKSMGYIGRVGMRSTDTEILNVMIDKVNVNQDC